jgi:hypothetical protein
LTIKSVLVGISCRTASQYFSNMKNLTVALLLTTGFSFAQVMPILRNKAGKEIPVGQYELKEYVLFDTLPEHIALIVSMDGKIGFYNASGNEIWQPTFDSYKIIGEPDQQMLIQVTTLDERENLLTGVLDSKAKVILPIMYSRIDPMYGSDNFQWIGTSEDKQGVLMGYTKIIIPPIYQEINMVDGTRQTFFNTVNSKGDVGLLDSLGRVIIPFGLSNYDINPDENSPLDGPVYFQLYKKKKYGYASSLRGVIIPIQYEYMESVKLGGQIYFPVKRGKKNGLIDGDGKFVIPLAYDNIESMELSGNVYSILKKGKKYGIVDKAGQFIVPVEYGPIDSLGESDPTGIFTLSDRNGQMFVLTKELKLIKSLE